MVPTIQNAHIVLRDIYLNADIDEDSRAMRASPAAALLWYLQSGGHNSVPLVVKVKRLFSWLNIST